MSRFSVVVPAFNAESTLAETFEAISGQEFTDWERIVVDDGSNDGTLELAEAFAVRDMRFRVIHQENRGSAGAMSGSTAVRALLDEVPFCIVVDSSSPDTIAWDLGGLVRDPDRIMSMKRVAVEAAPRYVWEMQGARLVEVYRTLRTDSSVDPEE